MTIACPTSARDLLRRHQPNTILFNDADDGPNGWADQAFHAGLAAPVSDELLETDADTPLLRWANPDVPAMALLDALLDPPNHRATTCDRCTKPTPRRRPVHRLWVAGGQSAVEFQVCHLCHDVLNDVYRAADGGRLLIWS